MQVYAILFGKPYEVQNVLLNYSFIGIIAWKLIL